MLVLSLNLIWYWCWSGLHFISILGSFFCLGLGLSLVLVLGVLVWSWAWFNIDHILCLSKSGLGVGVGLVVVLLLDFVRLWLSYVRLKEKLQILCLGFKLVGLGIHWIK